MKYTRYSITKKGNNKKISISFLIVLIIIGIMFVVTMNLVSKEKPIAPTVNTNEPVNNSTVLSEKKMELIQCGVFKEKTNADNLLSKIQKQGEACSFILFDGQLYKIYLGIFTDDYYKIIKDKLAKQGISVAKATVTIKYDDYSSREWYEITEALYKLINKVKDNNVKAINIGEFKKWCKDLKVPEENLKNYKEVSELQQYVLSLSDNIEKSMLGNIEKVASSNLEKILKTK